MNSTAYLRQTLTKGPAPTAKKLSKFKENVMQFLRRCWGGRGRGKGGILVKQVVIQNVKMISKTL